MVGLGGGTVGIGRKAGTPSGSDTASVIVGFCGFGSTCSKREENGSGGGSGGCQATTALGRFC